MTNREVLSKIPKYGSLAITRAKEQCDTFLERQSNSHLPSSILTYAFSWAKTEEGTKFWSDVLDNLRDNKL